MAERVLRGAPASPGLATGRARVLISPVEAQPEPDLRAEDAAGEAQRAHEALRRAAAALEAVGSALREAGRPDEAEIVETGVLMAADPLLASAVSTAVLERRRRAPAALLEATEEHAAAIAALPDALLAARADDVRSLGRRAASIAEGRDATPPANGSTFILVAEDLGPADVAEHGTRLAGIALSGGALTAHAAIVARSLGIPMTVQVGSELRELADGDRLVVDGSEGELILEPAPERVALASTASRERAHARAREIDDSALPAITADGRRVQVLVNAATAAEATAGLAAGAEGAGLVRTELEFLDATRWPSMAMHAAMLAPVLGALAGRPATVRVLDFGGDKLPPFLSAEPRRGIELLLAHPGALRAQLAAVAAADAGAGVRLLLPLVRDAADVRVTRAIMRSLGADVPLGAMIELPEAAESAVEIAAECDFMSVGTNDLTHATLGTDRFAHGEAPAHDPRVLRYIAASVRAAHEAGIAIEVCGEAASDPLTLPLLVGLDVDELSVGAARVGAVRAAVRGLEHARARAIAEQALAAPDAAAVEALVRPLATL